MRHLRPSLCPSSRFNPFTPRILVTNVLAANPPVSFGNSIKEISSELVTAGPGGPGGPAHCIGLLTLVCGQGKHVCIGLSDSHVQSPTGVGPGREVWSSVCGGGGVAKWYLLVEEKVEVLVAVLLEYEAGGAAYGCDVELAGAAGGCAVDEGAELVCDVDADDGGVAGA